MNPRVAGVLTGGLLRVPNRDTRIAPAPSPLKSCYQSQTPPLFFDFSQLALQQAESLGIDIIRMREDTRRIQQRLLTELSPSLLRNLLRLDNKCLNEALITFPGVLDLLRLKQHLSLNMLKEYREALPDPMELVPQAFPPPFDLLSGFSYASTAKFVRGIGVKLYTMHWPMILSDWGQAMSGNKISEKALGEALVNSWEIGQQAPDELNDPRL